jgi:predicted PurR-regulated permease PerM
MIASLRLLVVAAILAALGIGHFVVAPPAAAQTQQLPAQVQLTPELVEGFVGSYPELHALGEQLKQKYGAVNADPEDPSSFVTGYLQYADAKQQM